jgi:hypothetical protein
MREKPTNATVINSIYCVCYLLHISALHCHPQGAFLVPFGRCSVEELHAVFVVINACIHCAENIRSHCKKLSSPGDRAMRSLYISLLPKLLAVKAYGVCCGKLSNRMAVSCENHTSAALSHEKWFLNRR